MITRRSLFGILAGAIAAPIVVRSGLLMPVKAIIPASGIGVDEYLRRVIERVTQKMADEIIDDAMMFGQSWHRISLAGIERIPVHEVFLT